MYAHYDRRKETEAMKKTKKRSEVWKEREGEEGEGGMANMLTPEHVAGGRGRLIRKAGKENKVCESD